MTGNKEQLSHSPEKKNFSEKKEISVQDIERKLNEIGKLSETKILKKEAYDELQDTLTTIWENINTLKKTFEKNADAPQIKKLEELEVIRKDLKIDIQNMQNGFKEELQSFNQNISSAVKDRPADIQKNIIESWKNIENIAEGNDKNRVANQMQKAINRLLG